MASHASTMANGTPKKAKAHIWSFEVQRSAAEHFVTFLYNTNHLNENFTISKQDLYQVLHGEYQPHYHWNRPPFGVLPLLLRCKLIKKVRRGEDNNIITFNAKNFIPVVNKLTRSAKDGIPPPLEERLTQPVEVVIVSQQAAFRPKQQRKAGLTSLKCDICQVKFSSKALCDAHKDEEIHRLRETYRSNKKTLYASKELSVSGGNDASVLETCICRPGVKGTMKLYIANSTTKNVICVVDVIPLMDLPEVQIRHADVPFNVLPGSQVLLLLNFNFLSGGSYLYPFILKVRGASAEESTYVLKEVVFNCQSEFVDDLKPVSEFKPARPSKFKVFESPIVSGVPPPKTKTGLVITRPLSECKIPTGLKTLLSHKLTSYPTISNKLKCELMELKTLLGLDEKMEIKRCVLNPDTYSKIFSTLLHIEEDQMNTDIRNYDCEGKTLTKVKGSTLLAMEVPGLAENRPSVLRGDSIFVMFEGDPKKIRYEGCVHHIRELQVELGFHESFCKLYVEGMKLNVQFTFTRYPLKVKHRALSILEKCEGGTFMFPKQTKKLGTAVVPIKVWRNRNVEENEQQKTAVINIVNNTAYPCPYVVFGPPGTGKTVTVVEAVVQLWDLQKANNEKHILVCTPSNSAADVVALRLLNYIPPSSILRMYAASHSYTAVPELLRKCSNFDRDACYFPTKEAIMKYPIVIVTLITAGKLVGAGIPAGHYSHVFVDECGHAVEPEVMVPVAGLLVSEHNPGKMLGQLVLTGDPKQLGPILRSPLANSLGLGMSYLERLMEDEQLYKRSLDSDQYNPAVLTKLVKNFRSHKSILAVPNNLFYDGELEVHGGPEIFLACNWKELPKKNFPVIFHGVVGRDEREASSPSFFNIQEIDVVLSYLKMLFEDRLNGRKIVQSDVGIVTPYRRQVEKMRTALKKRNWKDVHAGSVEEFQGQERLIIIISTVRSSQKFVQDDYKFQLGFLKNQKRLNVALTRAKALLIVVGNPNVLQCDKAWRTFIKYCQDNGSYCGKSFVPLDEDEPVDSLVNGLDHLTLNSGNMSLKDDGPTWRQDI